MKLKIQKLHLFTSVVLCLFVSPGSAETLLRQDGKINCHLIAKSLVNVYAKNIKIGYCLLKLQLKMSGMLF